MLIILDQGVFREAIMEDIGQLLDSYSSSTSLLYWDFFIGHLW